MILYLDIETAPNDQMFDFVEKPRFALPSEAPKNYKRQEAIDSWIVKEDAKRDAEYQIRLDKMALDIDFARITEIGYALGDGVVEVAQVDPRTEYSVLREFWSAVAYDKLSLRICGFNVLGFDLPIIMRRSFMLEVPGISRVDLRRYSTASVIDLMQLFYHWGQGPGPRYRGLKAICKMHGIENLLPDLDGSKISEMDAKTRADYCANDVMMTRALANRMSAYYW